MEIPRDGASSAAGIETLRLRCCCEVGHETRANPCSVYDHTRLRFAAVNAWLRVALTYPGTMLDGGDRAFAATERTQASSRSVPASRGARSWNDNFRSIGPFYLPRGTPGLAARGRENLVHRVRLSLHALAESSDGLSTTHIVLSSRVQFPTLLCFPANQVIRKNGEISTRTDPGRSAEQGEPPPQLIDRQRQTSRLDGDPQVHALG